MKGLMAKRVGLILLATAMVTGCAFTDFGEIEKTGGNARAVTIANKNETGTHDGYDYELWRDYGNVSMTLENGGNFSCSWSNIGNVLFRKGKKFNKTQTHNQIGNISVEYSASFNPSGNAYLCIYGWSVDPLVEYYIVESYGTYKPTGTSKGAYNGYDLYESTRNNQPSIEGTKTFKQYWAVRQSKRTSGTVNVTDIFNAWYDKGMSLGKMYEVALTVEGYQSSGNAQINSHYLKIGSNSNQTQTPAPSPAGVIKVEAENMTKGGKYTSSCSSPFNGVVLYANDDKVSFSQNFANNSNTFKLRGASSNDREAQVQLRIGGTSYGTYKFKGTSPAEQSITVTHNKANSTATVELVCVNDNDTWDVLIDWIEISASGDSNTTPAPTPTPTPSATRVETENMTKGGKYTGSCSSPFTGVVLYANDDKVSYSQYFQNNSHTFKLRGASSNNNEAQVQLKIGGTSYGIFKFKGTSVTEQSITATHNKGGGNATVELVCVNDNDTWDVLLDWLEISN